MLNKIYDYPPTLARESTPTSHKNYVKHLKLTRKCIQEV